MKRLFMTAAVVLMAFAVLRAFTRPPLPTVVRASPPARPESAAARGRVVYERYGCAMCHGLEGKGGFANPNAETAGKVPGVLYVAEGYTASELRKRLLDGAYVVGKADPKGPRPPFRMPGWRGAMSEEEAGDLSAYLVSLYPESKEEKWR